MDARSQLPVSLPHANPTKSYWQDPPDPELANFLSSESLPEDLLDTVIIGCGITGTSVAWHLLNGKKAQGDGNKGEKIVMLEARQAGSGATGRNGGHTKAASYRSFPSNLQTLGKDEAIKIARLEYRTIQATHNFARAHNIDCESRNCDTVDIIYDDGQWADTISAIALMKEIFTEEGDKDGVARYHVYDASEAQKKFHVHGQGTEGESVKGAVCYEAGSISAYKFTIGILKLCMSRRLQLYTNTHATRIFKGLDGIWNIETERGVVKGKRVVVATNGYTARILKQFQGAIVPLRGQVTAQRPGSSMPSAGLETTYSFIYGSGYEYMISRPRDSMYPGDIVIGGGLVKAPQEGLYEYGTTDDTMINSIISTYINDSTESYFGSSWGDDHEDGRVRREWTGIMGYSPDGFPFVGEVPEKENMWIAAGFQGHGMALCWECGRGLVEMMDGVDAGEWFPEIFRVSKERMGRRFVGRLHTVPMGVEDNARL
ncbi:FAD dependent oxidoreductase [Amylocarpus encephaloides]|uniref:FAD dependent oxidoreductase n=1 Tax=Amylocarpus encephaloides TaxID=45428 RepID=A0A9P7YNP7_9HELO|nr:FAD dependent oxidoreductase [Amylocarpus encephaloides]